MATTGPSPENKGRAMTVKWQYLIPALLYVVWVASGCSPTKPVYPGTLDPILVPPSSSPIFTNHDSVQASFTHNSTTNTNRKTNVVIRTSCTDAKGESCNDHVSSAFTDQSWEQKRNRITPFNVKVSRNQEDGLMKVSVYTQECDAKDTTVCSPPQQDPYTFQVAFDTVPPVVSITPGTPSGLLTGFVSDSSPVASAQFGLTGSPDKTSVSVGTDGSLTVPYVPPVGGFTPEVTVVDAAGNSTTTRSEPKAYNFNAGLQIHSMQLNGSPVDLQHWSKLWGGDIKDGDVFVVANLPEGIDPATAALKFEQKNWRSFGFKTTLRDCTRLNQNAYDVAFSCTPSSTSKNTMIMKFTYTDQYGYSADFYYPAETNFTVGTRPMNLPETIQYIFEYALGIMAAFGVVGGLSALKINSNIHKKARSQMLEQVIGGDEAGAERYVQEARFLTNRQRERLVAEAKLKQKELEEQVRYARYQDHLSSLYAFPYAYHEIHDHDWTTLGHVPHDKLRESADHLNGLLKLGYQTDEFIKVRRDGDVITEQYANAVRRWFELNFVQPGNEVKNNFMDMVDTKWQTSPGQEEIKTMAKLFEIQSDDIYHSLWSKMKKLNPEGMKVVNLLTIVYAYHAKKIWNGEKVNGTVFNHLIARNTTIEEVVSALMKWGAPNISEFISHIPDPSERSKAEKHYKSFIVR